MFWFVASVVLLVWFFVFSFKKEIHAFTSVSYLNAEGYFVIYKLIASGKVCALLAALEVLG